MAVKENYPKKNGREEVALRRPFSFPRSQGAAKRRSTKPSSRLQKAPLIFGGQWFENGDKFTLRWFKKATANGDPRSALYLGFACAWGIDVPVDFLKAVKLYEAAVEKGLADAHFHLGFMYYFGNGVKQDFEQAAKCYREAVDRGYKVTEDHLDTCGHYRKATPKDFFKRYKWYALAVKRATNNG